MRKARLIVNPISGSGKGKSLAPLILRALERQGMQGEIRFTESSDAAAQEAASVESDVDVVVAAGGDGTLNAVLGGLKQQIPVALFPLGTANVLALELNLPTKPDAFAQMLLKGKTCSIDTMRANGRVGFFSLGVGFDGMMIEDLHLHRRGSIRKLSYLPVLWRCFWKYRTPRLRVIADGQIFENLSLALVANTKHYAGNVFSLSDQRQLDDGLYECYLFAGAGRVSLLRYLFQGVARRLASGRDPKIVKAKKIRIESMDSDFAVPFQIDGEFGGTTPVELEVIPNGMQIVIP